MNLSFSFHSPNPEPLNVNIAIIETAIVLAYFDLDNECNLFIILTSMRWLWSNKIQNKSHIPIMGIYHLNDNRLSFCLINIVHRFFSWLVFQLFVFFLLLSLESQRLIQNSCLSSRWNLLFRGLQIFSFPFFWADILFCLPHIYPGSAFANDLFSFGLFSSLSKPKILQPCLACIKNSL